MIELSREEQRQKLEEIYALISKAGELVSEAEGIAEEFGLEFSMDLGGYGMGGTYYSEAYVEREGLRYSEPGWNASSHSC